MIVHSTSQLTIIILTCRISKLIVSFCILIIAGQISFLKYAVIRTVLLAQWVSKSNRNCSYTKLSVICNLVLWVSITIVVTKMSDIWYHLTAILLTSSSCCFTYMSFKICTQTCMYMRTQIAHVYGLLWKLRNCLFT